MVLHTRFMKLQLLFIVFSTLDHCKQHKRKDNILQNMYIHCSIIIPISPDVLLLSSHLHDLYI